MTSPSPRSLVGGAAANLTGSLRVPDPQGPPPPLPEGIPFVAPDFRAGLLADENGPHAPFRTVRGGCYLVRYTPLQTSPTQPGAVHYFGTLRVDTDRSTITVSGDLYLHRIPTPPSPGRPEPDPGSGIPVFPLRDYRYYVRATQVLNDPADNESFTLQFELFRFIPATGSWSNDGAFTTALRWATTPPGYPSGADYLTGEVRSSGGSGVATMTLGWVSPSLRRAAIEIDRVSGGVAPLNNGAGAGWKEVFEDVRWDVAVIESDVDVPEPSGESWSDAEMHAAMLYWRDRRADLLDTEWRYHLLCVRRLDETPRGIMYDAFATDSNNVPREGVGIGADWVYPTDEPEWGAVQGTRFGDETATYFRTAVHELGHALGLYHNGADTGFMNTTDTIARRAQPSLPFPSNIRWAFHPDDRKRLRHMPDMWVRPGGLAFGSDYSVAPISADDQVEDANGLTLQVTAVVEALPLGAPARVEIALVNVSDRPIVAPATLSLKTGFVRGKVIDPSGTVRTFLPLIRCLEEQPLAILEPGQRVEHAMTLLRGPQGPLFPASGLYRVIVEVEWAQGSVMQRCVGATSLLVTGAATEEHSRVALQILSEPDTLLALILGGDSCPTGTAAIQAGAADSVLRPHYAWTEAKRLALRHFDRAPDPEEAAALSKDAIMTSAELQRAADLVEHLQAAEGTAGTSDRADGGDYADAKQASATETFAEVIKEKAQPSSAAGPTRRANTRAPARTRAKRKP